MQAYCSGCAAAKISGIYLRSHSIAANLTGPTLSKSSLMSSSVTPSAKFVTFLRSKMRHQLLMLQLRAGAKRANNARECLMRLERIPLNAESSRNGFGEQHPACC